MKLTFSTCSLRMACLAAPFLPLRSMCSADSSNATTASSNGNTTIIIVTNGPPYAPAYMRGPERVTATLDILAPTPSGTTTITASVTFIRGFTNALQAADLLTRDIAEQLAAVQSKARVRNGAG